MSLQNVSLLHSRAVLVRLFTSAFIGNPLDKTLTAEVENAHGIRALKKVSVRKKILQGDELNAVSASLQRVRLLTEKLSAPWLDGGLRIVASKSLIETKIKIEAAIREFENTVDLFLAAYDDLIAKDRIALNGTFRASDYPSKDRLRAKFAARIEVLPLPSRDFRVEGISAAVCAELTAEMDRQTADRVADAKKDLIGRIQDRVATLAAKVSAMTDQSRFHASTLGNVSEVCAEVKAANFDGDPMIDALADKIEAAIKPLDAEAIRDNETARAEAKQTAENALAEISAAMAGFC